ncbi:MAG: glycosyltransferase family 4 protein, partial [Anaerolineaceae bacterium]|nr:glycosyltransferase family 4 protein [Anaerolineaceae bacterium]
MNSPRRILYFSRNLTTHDVRFLTSLAKTDMDVYYLRLEIQNTNLDENSLPEKVHILPTLNDRKFRFKNIFGNVNKLRRIIDQINPDIVHAGPIQSCGFLTALTGFTPLITMSWGSDILVDSEKNIFWNWITKFTLKRTSIFIGDCEVVKTKAKSMGFPENRIVQFPWGIDLNHFQPGNNLELRNQLGWNDKFILLSLRSWEKIYGVDLVARTFVEASKSEPDLRLILLGNGSQEVEIKTIFEEAGIIDRVYLGGVIGQKALPDYYHASDLYISASFSDGSSVSLMEALASGLPVLVSDIPGNKEWIDHDRNGWLFETGSVENLAKSILIIFKNKANLSQVGIEARKSAEKKANWDVN